MDRLRNNAVCIDIGDVFFSKTMDNRVFLIDIFYNTDKRTSIFIKSGQSDTAM